MANTPNLILPYILAAQAQKHVTHNEAITALDAVVQLSVKDRDLTNPPASPVDGDRFVVAIGGAGVWAGKDGQIAAFQDNAWSFYVPRTGWLSYVADEAILYIYNGTSWSAFSSGGLGGASALVNNSPFGSQTRFELVEEELTLAGAFVDSTIQIPDRAIVFGVSTRTTQAVTGATSYDCGIAGNVGKYGATLGAALGSNNSGVTGPTAFYANTPIRITANGGNFTGGNVRFAIHYMLCIVPTS